MLVASAVLQGPRSTQSPIAHRSSQPDGHSRSLGRGLCTRCINHKSITPPARVPQKMRRLLFFSSVLLLSSLTSALPTSTQDAKPSGLTIPALDSSTAQSPDILAFITSAPNYIAKAFSYSDTACSLSRVLPIFCGEHTLDERRQEEEEQVEKMAEDEVQQQTCGSGFEGWVCSVTTHTALIAFVFLIFAPLLALGIYKWKKVCFLTTMG